MSVAILLGAVGMCSWLLTGVWRRLALQRQLLDVPNARSSHARATPRGGGVAIVLVCTAGFLLWPWMSGTPAIPTAVLVASLAVAGVGFIDDLGHVSPVVRLLVHVASAAAVVVTVGTWPGVPAPWAVPITVFAIVWMVNLTNFMDGIDGIAAGECASVCGLGAGLAWWVGFGASTAVAPAIVAAACLGFLVWNWPPARLFMGDVGSGYLGFLAAALAIQAGQVSAPLVWAWAILAGVFVVDASWTLARRVWRRERVFDAHRSHAYQRLTDRWGGHRPVTQLTLLLNVVWLAPIATAVAAGGFIGPPAVAAAYLPLLAGVVWVGTQPEPRSKIR